jgi:hypothetical protein
LSIPENIDSARWMFEREGRRYGPVTTQQIQDLCREGIIIASMRVHSSLFNRWVDATHVPALRPILEAPINGLPRFELLQGIPSASAIDSPSGPRPWYAPLPKDTTGALIAAALLVIGAVALGAAHFAGAADKEITHRIGDAIGVVIVTIILGMLAGWVAAMLAHLIFGSRRAVAIVTFNLGALVILIATSVSEFRVHQQHSADNALAKQYLAELRASKGDLEALLAHPATAPATNPSLAAKPPSSEMSRFIQLSRDIAKELEDEHGRYLQTLRDQHMDRLLSAENLAHAENYAPSRRACDATYAALKRMEKEQQQTIDSVAARARSLGGSEDFARQFMGGFNAARAKDEPFLRQSFKLEHMQIDAYVAMLDFMEPYADQVSVRDGQLYFPTQDVASAFNTRMHRVLSLAASSRELVAQHQQEVQQRMDRWASTVD